MSLIYEKTILFYRKMCRNGVTLKKQFLIAIFFIEEIKSIKYRLKCQCTLKEHSSMTRIATVTKTFEVPNV